VAAAYKGGGMLMVGSLLDSGSPSEFALRLGYLEQLAGDHRSALNRLTAARFAAREKTNEALTAREVADRIAAKAASSLAASQAAAATADRAATAVTALIDQREQAAADAASEREAVLARYEQLKAESARIEAALRAAAARSKRQVAVKPSTAAPSAPESGGYLLMPISGGHRTSTFGMRFHPLFHTWLMHSGMDIGAATGTPIYAADDGEVVTAGWRGGYGNYTCISHGSYQGRNMATCYGHQSKILVSDGQQVRRGQVIGRVGSTGNSTGAHLHFEVRLNGSPANPASWL